MAKKSFNAPVFELGGSPSDYEAPEASYRQPQWNVGSGISQGFKQLVGDFQWDPNQPFTETGWLASRGYGNQDGWTSNQYWNPEKVFGTGGFLNVPWGADAPPSKLFSDPDTFLSNVYTNTDPEMLQSPWSKYAFKGGDTPEDYNIKMSDAMTGYRKGVADILKSYYGTDAATKWAQPLYGKLQWEHELYPHVDAYTWEQPMDGTVTKGEGVLGQYYQQWDKVETMGEYSSGDAFDLKGEDSVYHKLRSGELAPHESAGNKVRQYFQDRGAATEEFFGVETDALKGWDPARRDTWRPSIQDDQGNTKYIDLDSTDREVEQALGKYSEGSAMNTHLKNIQRLKLEMKGLQPLGEDSPYEGLYEGQKTILEGLFGSGDHINPEASSKLGIARSNFQTIADNFYSNPEFGEQALATAITNSTTNADEQTRIWEDANAAAGEAVLGLSDYNKDDLIGLGFIDDNYELQYSGEAGSAEADDALEGESELAYQIRMQLDTGGTGAANTYTTNYDNYVETRAENLKAAHEDFQGDFEAASSEYASGQIQLKERAAKQKGLRMGTMKRVEDQLRSGLAESFGEDKLDLEDFTEKEKLQFDNNIEQIAANLTSTWEAQFGGSGALEQAETTMNTNLGNIFGTYSITDPNTGARETGLPHTEDSIKAIMQQGFTPGQPITITADFGNGQETKTITMNTKGQYGDAIDSYKNQKFGQFGTIAKDAGYSPGSDGKFGVGSGDAEDEMFVGVGEPGADEYGWKKGNIPEEDLETYAGMKLPTAVQDRLTDYGTAGVYDSDLRQFQAEYASQLGGKTDEEAGIVTGEDLSFEDMYKGAGGLFGKAGDMGEDALAAKKLEESTDRDIALRGMGARFEGTGSESEKAMVDSFKRERVEVTTATIKQWENMFSDVGANTIQSKIDLLKSSVRSIAGEGSQAGTYLDWLGDEAKKDSKIVKLIEEDWSLFDDEGLGRTGDNNEGDDGGGIGVVVTAVVTAVVVHVVKSCITNPAACIAFLSDRKLKKNIKNVGTHKGLNVYTFNYLWDNKKRTGFMADEVERVVPEAVINSGNYKKVNYYKVLRSL